MGLAAAEAEAQGKRHVLRILRAPKQPLVCAKGEQDNPSHLALLNQGVLHPLAAQEGGWQRGAWAATGFSPLPPPLQLSHWPCFSDLQ